MDYRDWTYEAGDPSPRSRGRGRHSADPDPVRPEPERFDPYRPEMADDRGGRRRSDDVPHARWTTDPPQPYAAQPMSRGRHRHAAEQSSPARRRPDDTFSYERDARPPYGDGHGGGDRPGGRRRAPEPPDDGGQGTGAWERMTDTGQYVRTATTGAWDRLTDTGPQEPPKAWDRMTDTGAQARALAWDRMADTDVHDRAQERFDAFWSGHRLAGDDPRWMATPTSAPRSPAISYPEDPPPSRASVRVTAPRPGLVPPPVPPAAPPLAPPLPPPLPPPLAPPPPVAEPRVPMGRTGVESAPRPAMRPQARPPQARPPQARPPQARPALAPTRAPQPVRPPRRPPPPMEELDGGDNGGTLAALLYTAAWYAVPVLVFAVWIMTLDGSTPIGCVSDVTGGGCESERAHALSSLLDGAPTFGLALAASLVAAILLRWMGRGWRAVSVGIGAAVVGGGLSTVLMSAISGQPIG